MTADGGTAIGRRRRSAEDDDRDHARPPSDATRHAVRCRSRALDAGRDAVVELSSSSGRNSLSAGGRWRSGASWSSACGGGVGAAGRRRHDRDDDGDHRRAATRAGRTWTGGSTSAVYDRGLESPQTPPIPHRVRTRRPRHRARRRLRRPVRPADRPPRARAGRVLRDRAQPHHRRRDCRAGAGGDHPVGRPGERPRRRGPVPRPGDLRPRCPDPRHLLRRPADRPAARRHRGPRDARRVRPGQVAAHRAVSGPARRRAGRARRVDEPLRRHHRGAGGFHRHRGHRGRPGRRARGRRAQRIYGVQFHPEVVHSPYGMAVLRRFLHERAGIAGRLDDGVGHRRAGRPDPGRGRRRTGALRAVRRRRLLGRRGARPPGDRSPAHLRLRRHRADAQGRERAGRRDVPPQPRHRADPRRRRRPVLRGASTVSPSPRPSARRSATSSSASSRSTPAGSSRPSSSSRARCTPTSSSPAAATAPRR